MGKKKGSPSATANTSSTSIASVSKINKNKQKQELNSPIKVLRPRVYITDNSTFKTLVQQLTGNGTTTLANPSAADPVLLQPQMHQKVPELVDSEDKGGLQEVSSLFSSADLWNQLLINEELEQTWDQIYMDVTSSMNQQLDLSAIQELESWLLDTAEEPCSFSVNGNTQTAEDIINLKSYQLWESL